MVSNLHHLSSFRIISTVNIHPLQPTNITLMNFSTRKCFRISSGMKPSMAAEATSLAYQKFVHFALQETTKHTHLVPSTLQEKFGCLTAMDGKTELQMQAFESPKIRLLRSLYIEGSDGMQLLPWGGKITAESMKFFSPIVIWTKFPPSEQKHHLLYSAFKDYLKSWLQLMDQASAETDASQIKVNIEAQHKYLTWRTEKDPGHQVLRRLVGESQAKEIIRSFLFGADELGC